MIAIMKDIETGVSRKGAALAPMVGAKFVRIEDWLTSVIDKWHEKQDEEPSRSEAIRQGAGAEEKARALGQEKRTNG